MKISRCLLALLCLFGLPLTARADGIDLPIAVAAGVGFFLPLLLFNAIVEAPIMSRFLGVRFAELWVSWFKANVWSLVAGIPAMMLNDVLAGWFLPLELSRRVWAYPFLLILFIFVFYVATCLVEFFYARKIVRKNGLSVGRSSLIRGVVLANLASYVILGPIYFYIAYPRSDVREFSANASWSKQPKLQVVAVNKKGNLVTSSINGENHRIVVPYEVRDYVVSADLKQVLYRGVGDRLFLFSHGRNQPIPETGADCRVTEMDFSPSGRYAAFINREKWQIQIFDPARTQFREVPCVMKGTPRRLVWSSREDTFYLRTDAENWKFVIGPFIGSEPLTTPPTDFADHYVRVGYIHHTDGSLRLMVNRGFGNHLAVWNQNHTIMRFKDPAGGRLSIEHAVFLEGSNEVLVGVGDCVCVLDIFARRIGPVIEGRQFITLTESFSKHADERF